MRAYYFDNVSGDQRLPHDSGIPVDVATLAKIGVLLWHIPVTGEYTEVDAIAEERGYKNRDTISITKEGLGDLYETRLKSYYEEHMHEDEEIRYILDGSGFHDIREHPTNKWIRCALEPGDLVVYPAGMYHRFTLDEKDMLKAMMLFKDKPKWSSYNRGEAADASPCRVNYLKSIAVN